MNSLFFKWIKKFKSISTFQAKFETMASSLHTLMENFFEFGFLKTFLFRIQINLVLLIIIPLIFLVQLKIQIWLRVIGGIFQFFTILFNLITYLIASNIIKKAKELNQHTNSIIQIIGMIIFKQFCCYSFFSGSIGMIATYDKYFMYGIISIIILNVMKDSSYIVQIIFHQLLLFSFSGTDLIRLPLKEIIYPIIILVICISKTTNLEFLDANWFDILYFPISSIFFYFFNFKRGGNLKNFQILKNLKNLKSLKFLNFLEINCVARKHTINSFLGPIDISLKFMHNHIRNHFSTIFQCKDSDFTILPSFNSIDLCSYYAGIVHDLRNPVGSVITIFEFLLESENLDSEEKSSIQLALFCCKFQLILINSLLDMAKIKAGKFELIKEKFSLPNLITTIMKMETEVAKRKNIKVQSEILNNLPEEVIGDGNRMTQIILNLLGNSVKFTHQGFIKLTCGWYQDFSEIDFSDMSFKDSLFSSKKRLHRKNQTIFINKSSFETNSFKEELNEGEIFADCSIQHNMANYYFVTRKGSFNGNEKFDKLPQALRNKFTLRIKDNGKNVLFKSIGSTQAKGYNTPQEFFKFNNMEDKGSEKKIPHGFFNKKFEPKENENGILYLEIVDTGEGIKIEEQSKLFQPFSQATSSQQSKGTGLGLWLCSKFIELMKGKIKLYSEINKGTVIKIALPLTLYKLIQSVSPNASQRIDDATPIHSFPSIKRHISSNLQRHPKFNIYIFSEDPIILTILHPLKTYINCKSIETTIYFKTFKDINNINYDLKFPTIFIFSINIDTQFNFLNSEIQRIRKIEIKEGFLKGCKQIKTFLLLSFLI